MGFFQRRKGQVAYEFIFAFLILVSIYFVWNMVVNDAYGAYLEDQRAEQLTVTGNQIQEGIYTAIMMGDGFETTLNIPMTIMGKEFEPGIVNIEGSNFLNITMGDNEELFKLPRNITGDIIKGDNYIIINKSQVAITQ